MLLHHSLPGGVRLRLPHRGDLPAITDLCTRHGRECDAELLLRFDPRDRAVVCAVAFSGEGEDVVGIGWIALHRGAEAEVLAGDAAVAESLRSALQARLQARPRPPRRRSERVVRAALRRTRLPVA